MTSVRSTYPKSGYNTYPKSGTHLEAYTSNSIGEGQCDVVLAEDAYSKMWCDGIGDRLDRRCMHMLYLILPQPLSLARSMCIEFRTTDGIQTQSANTMLNLLLHTSRFDS